MYLSHQDQQICIFKARIAIYSNSPSKRFLLVLWLAPLSLLTAWCPTIWHFNLVVLTRFQVWLLTVTTQMFQVQVVKENSSGTDFDTTPELSIECSCPFTQFYLSFYHSSSSACEQGSSFFRSEEFPQFFWVVSPLPGDSNRGKPSFF